MDSTSTFTENQDSLALYEPMTLSVSESPFYVVRYTADLKSVWDSFVDETKNGTFLFLRDYMEYHADRFQDYSLMFYKGKQLLALLPANLSGDTFCSHGGLTYGGFLISRQVTEVTMLTLFSLLCRYLREHTEAIRLIYHPIPHIYHSCPSEEDLYALFCLRAQLTERKVSSVILNTAKLPVHRSRRGKIKMAKREGLKVCTDTAFELFWPVLTGNLQQRHGTVPVHSLEEITRLHVRFPENIMLHRVTDAEGETLGGCVIYVTRQVVHVQYIGSTERGKRLGAIDLLFDTLLNEYYAGQPYFDFGTSVENGGRYLNEGLIFQKEGFGGRAVMYDVYELSLPLSPM